MVEGKVSSGLKLAELRPESVRQTLDKLHDHASWIVSFSKQFKDIVDYYDSTRIAIEERSKELHLIQESVEETVKKLESKEEELEVVQESVRRRLREVQARKDEFELRQKRQNEERRREIEWIEESREELESVRREIEEREERLKLINISIEERANEVRVLEKEVSERLEDTEQKEMQFREQCRKFEFEKKKFMGKIEAIELKETELKEQCSQYELEKKKFTEKFEEIELKEKKLEERKIEIELGDKKLMERKEEFELKEKQLEARCREVELKERKIAESSNMRVMVEPFSYTCDNEEQWKSSSDGTFCLSMIMDGKALQIFLNERWSERDSMKNEVAVALRLSPDPPKLVLDAMQGFYPPHLKKGDVEFDGGVVRRSCILLLEELMKISPSVKPHVRKEAMTLAVNWMTKTITDAEHSLENLGLLLLLASYGLVSTFDADELLRYVEIVVQHHEVPELLHVLGFTDKISALGFNTRSPLLNEKNCASPEGSIAASSGPHSKSASSTHLAVTSAPTTNSPTAHVIKAASQQSGIKSPWTKSLAEDNPNAISGTSSQCGASIVSSVKLVAEQLADLSANHGSCHTPLQVRIEQLLAGDMQLESTNMLDPQPKPTPSSLKMDAQHLKQLLNNEGKYDLIRGQVSDALQFADDPAKLVLEAIMRRNGHFLGVPKNNCYIILEQLKTLSPLIKPGVRDKALGAARAWKTRFVHKKNDPLEVICFLQLLAVYRLATFFNADELFGLLNSTNWQQDAVDLLKDLGLANEVPKFIQKLIRRDQRMEAIKCIYAFHAVGRFPPATILEDHLRYCFKKIDDELFDKRKDEIGNQIEAINKALNALNTLVQCIAGYEIKSRFLPKIEQKIMQLKNQKKEKFSNMGNKKVSVESSTSSDVMNCSKWREPFQRR